jgi:multidrug efflux pump subunit AcrA (membrane-fusion protein)
MFTVDEQMQAVKAKLKQRLKRSTATLLLGSVFALLVTASNEAFARIGKCTMGSLTPAEESLLLATASRILPKHADLDSIAPLAPGENLMAKVSERERIQALEAKLKQLKTLQTRREARARTTAAKRARGEALRRKILAGAVLLAKVEAGEFEEATSKAWMSGALTRPEDLALFGLEGSREP